MNRREFLASSVAAVSASLPLPDRSELFLDNVPNAYRMRMHWYIFGPAWEKKECRRELQLMAAAHIGGVLIFPTYPIAVDDAPRGIHNQNYLSDEFLDTFRYVCETCRELGLTVDIVLGTGWPYGGPSVSLEDSAKSIKQRRFPIASREAIALPPLEAGEMRLAVFQVAGASINEVREQEARVTPLDGGGEIREYYATPTRMQVKRASLGAEGLVVDHYNEAALQRYLAAVGDRLLGSVPRGAVRSVFCDSLEVYRATWTAGFAGIFQAKAGYDLRPKLPLLFDESLGDAREVRYDFWRILSDLAYEQFIVPLQKSAHAHGVTTQVEAYGTPPVSLAAYRSVDVPTGEHYEWKEFSSSRWASSGGHLGGKPVILAEAWTWAGLPNRFADSLEQLKLCSDLHFLSGINALYGVTYAYSPESVGSPGWVPYFGPATNHTSPYWPYFSHFADYVNRASYVLQQGKPANSIALYLPAEDCMGDAPPEQLLLNWAVRDRLSSNGPPPEFRLKNALHYESDVVKTIITNGYGFDGVDAFVMREMSVSGGRLRVGDGDYEALVLPNLTMVDPSSVKKIREFVNGGGKVIATKQLPEALRDLHGRENVLVVADEQGSFRAALRRQVEPDIVFSEPSEHVSFVRRRAEDRDWFFVVNTSKLPQALDATFRVPTSGRVCEAWDLITGRRTRLTGEAARIRFELGPLESRVYVFGPGQTTPKQNEPLKTVREEFIPLDVGEWTLTLAGAEKRLRLAELVSWTAIPEARFYSGRGIYECQFRLSADIQVSGRLMLDLGRVRETADVKVNGKSAGVAWMRPYQVDITGLVQRGENKLQIDVTNLLINEILGKGPIDYSAVFAKYGQRFPAGDEWTVVGDPLPSGLLGPVRLVVYR